MKSTKNYRDFVLEQLSDVPEVFCRAMMGGYLLYSAGVLFGGIYSDRLLVKKTETNAGFDMPEVIPYDGSKKTMYQIEDIDDKEKVTEIVMKTVEGLHE